MEGQYVDITKKSIILVSKLLYQQTYGGIEKYGTVVHWLSYYQSGTKETEHLKSDWFPATTVRSCG